jgi:peptidoglycan/xylan/chitin deacetylase (PgdA/CDA1 family)
LWRDQFDWVYRKYYLAIFPLTIHPDVSGRPQLLLMLERLIEYISGHSGARWCTMEEMAEVSTAPSVQGLIRNRHGQEPSGGSDELRKVSG